MWNDTIPLGFLITFRCYGTWLHGDERGSTDRHNNVYKSPHIPRNENWKEYNTEALRGTPVKLGVKERQIVERAIRETCELRNWHLMALNVRTNHVHIVVYPGGKEPGRLLNAFKSNATRMLREADLWTNKHSPWADKGSNIYLWTERNLAIAVEYVIDGQGGPLPEFE
jgi:REP element-mobilizing transposase RayT